MHKKTPVYLESRVHTFTGQMEHTSLYVWADPKRRKVSSKGYKYTDSATCHPIYVAVRGTCKARQKRAARIRVSACVLRKALESECKRQYTRATDEGVSYLIHSDVLHHKGSFFGDDVLDILYPKTDTDDDARYLPEMHPEVIKCAMNPKTKPENFWQQLVDARKSADDTDRRLVQIDVPTGGIGTERASELIRGAQAMLAELKSTASMTARIRAHEMMLEACAFAERTRDQSLLSTVDEIKQAFQIN